MYRRYPGSRSRVVYHERDGKSRLVQGDGEYESHQAIIKRTRKLKIVL
jgi:hypothetical protein